jgi:PTH1 family peptidyl-tRNA hydrolase
MRLLVGLGNPGGEYESTRHNAGFYLVDTLQKVKLPKDFVVRKSDMFMNESGIFVKKLVDRYELDINNLYIAHDDLDIPLGAYKIQFGIGPKVHNGVNSVEQELGTKDFWRIRIGVDNRKSDERIQGEEYVLQDFSKEERKILNSIITEICKKLATSSINTS